MATYAQRAALANDATFQGRTENGAIKYALYLGPTDDDSDAWHLARSVLNNPEHWSRFFALAISSEPETLSGGTNDPAVNSDDGDTALQYAIEQRVWPAYAAGMSPGLGAPPTSGP